MSEYSDAFLDSIYRMDRMEINPVQNKYSDMLLDCFKDYQEAEGG